MSISFRKMIPLLAAAAGLMISTSASALPNNQKNYGTQKVFGNTGGTTTASGSGSGNYRPFGGKVNIPITAVGPIFGNRKPSGGSSNGTNIGANGGAGVNTGGLGTAGTTGGVGTTGTGGSGTTGTGSGTTTGSGSGTTMGSGSNGCGSGGFTITHGGGNLPKEPGNMHNKCKYDGKHWCYGRFYGDYCFPGYTYVEGCPLVTVACESSHLRVPVGSIVVLNGSAFGPMAGSARLRVGGMVLPVEVVEWSPSAVKVRLPQFDLTSMSVGKIELFRADGSSVSRTNVELVGTPEAVALGR
jgi:hypothetical protein